MFFFAYVHCWWWKFFNFFSFWFVTGGRNWWICELFRMFNQAKENRILSLRLQLDKFVVDDLLLCSPFVCIVVLLLFFFLYIKQKHPSVYDDDCCASLHTLKIILRNEMKWMNPIQSKCESIENWSIFFFLIHLLIILIIIITTHTLWLFTHTHTHNHCLLAHHSVCGVGVGEFLSVFMCNNSWFFCCWCPIYNNSLACLADLVFVEWMNEWMDG